MSGIVLKYKWHIVEDKTVLADTDVDPETYRFPPDAGPFGKHEVMDMVEDGSLGFGSILRNQGKEYVLVPGGKLVPSEEM